MCLYPYPPRERTRIPARFLGFNWPSQLLWAFEEGINLKIYINSTVWNNLMPVISGSSLVSKHQNTTKKETKTWRKEILHIQTVKLKWKLSLRKTRWNSPEFPNDPGMTLEYLCKRNEIRNWKTYSLTHVHAIIIYNSQNVKTTKVSVSRELVKHNVLSLHAKYFCSLQK